MVNGPKGHVIGGLKKNKYLLVLTKVNGVYILRQITNLNDQRNFIYRFVLRGKTLIKKLKPKIDRFLDGRNFKV